MRIRMEKMSRKGHLNATSQAGKIREMRMLEVDLLEITKITIHVFLKILIPYSNFSRSYETDIQDYLVRVFSKIPDICDFYFLRFSGRIRFKNDSVFILKTF